MSVKTRVFDLIERRKRLDTLDIFRSTEGANGEIPYDVVTETLARLLSMHRVTVEPEWPVDPQLDPFLRVTWVG